jgi:hypothetical protein
MAGGIQATSNLNVGNAIKMLKVHLLPRLTDCRFEGPILYRNSLKEICRLVETQYNGDYPIDPCFKMMLSFSANNVSGTEHYN